MNYFDREIVTMVTGLLRTLEILDGIGHGGEIGAVLFAAGVISADGRRSDDDQDDDQHGQKELVDAAVLQGHFALR